VTVCRRRNSNSYSPQESLAAGATLGELHHLLHKVQESREAVNQAARTPIAPPKKEVVEWIKLLYPRIKERWSSRNAAERGR
jgi:hypothetical protein